MTISIWTKIRLIIIAFKYGQSNKRELLAQIKVLNIIQYNIPQLGKLFISY